MSHRSLFLFALLLLLVPVSAARAQPATVKGPDYSKQGGPFAALSGLNFHDIERIEYVGPDRAAAYGVQLDAEKFLVESWVEVPRQELLTSFEDTTYKSEFETKMAEIEVWVGRDTDDRIHDEMLKGVHLFWTVNKPGLLGKIRPVQASEQVTFKKGKYLLFRILDQPVHHLAPFARRVVWADGKVVWFRFKRFTLFARPSPEVPHNPDAAVDSFVMGRFSVQAGQSRLNVQPMKGSFRKEFFKLYEQGAFRGSV